VIKMQEVSLDEDVDDRLHIHASVRADKYKRELLSEASSVSELRFRLEKIAAELLMNVAEALGHNVSPAQIVPIIVMRGGLSMYTPITISFAGSPIGFVLPVRNTPGATPEVVYESVPAGSSDRCCLILDQIIATGDTMSAVLNHLMQQSSESDTQRYVVAAPFASSVGVERLLSDYELVHIHTIWHREKLRNDGRMDGPGFDIGDCVCGIYGEYS